MKNNDNGIFYEEKDKRLSSFLKIPKLTHQEEKEFEEYFNRRSIIFFRLSLVMYILVLVPYFFLDYYNAPVTHQTVWLLRFFFFFPGIFIGLYLSYKDIIIKKYQPIVNSLNFIFNLGIISFLVTTQPYELAHKEYYVGIILVMSSALGMRIRLKFVVYNFITIFIIYFILAILFIYQNKMILIDNLYFVITVMAAIITSAYILEISYKTDFLQKKALEHQKEKIQIQKNEIEAQRDEIEAQRNKVLSQKKALEKIHDELSSSIEYARHIQESVLPPQENLNSFFTDSFLFFKPKNVVSGDFYWWYYNKIFKTVVITIADCTGHGVPGAFMSMLGISFLRELVIKENLIYPGTILDKMRKEIISTLAQEKPGRRRKDGMDMSVVSINIETKEVFFAGANNSMYFISGRDLNKEKNKIDWTKVKISKEEKQAVFFYEFKPDKMPISVFTKMDDFTTHEFKIESGDIIYLFTDGFVDQFGGPLGKKFKNKPFKELLLNISKSPMIKQKEVLNDTLHKWLNYNNYKQEQIDDITILGIRI